MKVLLLACLLLAVPAGAAERWVGRFSAGDLEGWERHAFHGRTEYRLVTEDGQRFLRAHARAGASGLVRRETIDLRRTPWLHWSWRPHGRLDGLDERRRGGDDYVARIYAVIDGGLAFWRTHALSLVWSSNQARGSVWPNAYAPQAVMVALRGREDTVGRWRRESVDLRALLRRHLGRDHTRIDALALMTDADDSGREAITDYGDIFLSSEGEDRP